MLLKLLERNCQKQKFRDEIKVKIAPSDLNWIKNK